MSRWFIYDLIHLNFSSKDYNYFGVQNGDECYCGDVITTAIQAPEYQCNKPCKGNQSEFCGSHWRLNLYQHNGNGNATSASTNTSSTTSTTTRTTTRTTTSTTTSTTTTVPVLPPVHITDSIWTTKFFNEEIEIESELKSILESNDLIETAKVSVTGVKASESNYRRRDSRESREHVMQVVEFIAACYVRNQTQLDTEAITKVQQSLIESIENSELENSE